MYNQQNEIEQYSNYHYNKMLFSITIKYIEKRGCGELRKAARMCLTYRVWFKYTPNVTNDFLARQNLLNLSALSPDF